MRPWPTVATPSSRRIEERRRESGRGDHVVRPRGRSRPAASFRARACANPLLVRSIRSTAASRANVPPPEARVLVAAAGSAREPWPGRHRGLHRPRRDEDDLARPGQQPVGDLEAGVPLADDEDALALVLGGRARVHVVGDGRRCPGWASFQGSVTPDARTRPTRAAVLAVGGREHEPAVVLAPRRLPAAAVADATPRLSANAASPRSISVPRRDHVRPVHERRRTSAWHAGSSGDEAVVVVPLVLAGRPARRARRASTRRAGAGRSGTAGTCRRAPSSCERTACSMPRRERQ